MLSCSVNITYNNLLLILIVLLNMEDLRCRICLTEGNFMSIFEESLRISAKIMSLANVAIHPNDGLPSTICSTCTGRLENCIDFVEQCKKSDLHLRSNANNIKHNNGHNIKKCEEVNVEVSGITPISEQISPYSDLVHNLSTDTNLDADIKYIDNLKVINKTNISSNINKCESKRTQKQQCSTCGKVMSSRFRLKTHQQTHTGERPFVCPNCNKTFSLAQNLKVHLRIHTGEKPFKCTTCGEAFAHSAGLAVHRRKHTGQQPYKCILCPRSFRTVGHLQYHVRRHTGAKNFECCTCGRAFITRSDLKQHIATHTGEKPHVCCICGMRLTRSSHLKRHIRFIHQNEKHSQSNGCNKLEKCEKNGEPNHAPDDTIKT